MDEKNLAFGERLQQFLNNQDLNQTRFAEKIGRSKQNVSTFLKGKSKPSFEVMMDIFNAFPELNPRWLLAGEEPMLLEGRSGESICQEKLDKATMEIQLLNKLLEEKERMIQHLLKGQN